MATERRRQVTMIVGHIDIVRVDIDHVGVKLTLWYPHCQRCDWDGEKVVQKFNAQVDGGVHERVNCIADTA